MLFWTNIEILTNRQGAKEEKEEGREVYDFCHGCF
jgi:hypothetical protein